MGTMVLLLGFKDLWFVGRWFPSFEALLRGDLWFTPAPGDLDPKFPSLYVFRYHGVPGDRFSQGYHLSRFLNKLLSRVHAHPHCVLAVRRERRSCRQVTEKTLDISLQRLKCILLLISYCSWLPGPAGSTDSRNVRIPSVVWCSQA